MRPCRHLVVSWDHFDISMPTAVLSLTNLTHLIMSAKHIGDDGFEDFGEDGAQVFAVAQLAPLTNLQRLIYATESPALHAGTPALPQLVHLRLQNKAVRWRPRGIRQLLHFPRECQAVSPPPSPACTPHRRTHHHAHTIVLYGAAAGYEMQAGLQDIHFDHLPQLTHLTLPALGLSCPPPAITRLTGLVTLSLGQNPLQYLPGGPYLDTLAHLTIPISYMRSLPRHLARAKNLAALTLGSMQAKDHPPTFKFAQPDIDILCALPALKRLSIDQTLFRCVEDMAKFTEKFGPQLFAVPTLKVTFCKPDIPSI